MERRSIAAYEALPCIGVLNPDKLRDLVGAFREGTHIDFNPATLVQTWQGILVADGNHRLTVASLYQVAVPAIIYNRGEVRRPQDHEDIEGFDPTAVINFDRWQLLKLRTLRLMALAGGYRSFADCANYAVRRGILTPNGSVW